MLEGQEHGLAAQAIIRAGREIVDRVAANVSGTSEQLDESFVAAVQLISGLTGKVITSGAGTSGIVADRMAHILSVTGTPAFFLHPSDGLHGGLGAVTPGDAVIVLSKGGHSEEVNDFVARAKDRGAPVIALTGDNGSESRRPWRHCGRAPHK